MKRKEASSNSGNFQAGPDPSEQVFGVSDLFDIQAGKSRAVSTGSDSIPLIAFSDTAGDVEHWLFLIRRLAPVAGPNLRSRDLESVVFEPSVAAASPVFPGPDIFFIRGTAAAVVSTLGKQVHLHRSS